MANTRATAGSNPGGWLPGSLYTPPTTAIPVPAPIGPAPLNAIPIKPPAPPPMPTLSPALPTVMPTSSMPTLSPAPPSPAPPPMPTLSPALIGSPSTTHLVKLADVDYKARTHLSHAISHGIQMASQVLAGKGGGLGSLGKKSDDDTPTTAAAKKAAGGGSIASLLGAVAGPVGAVVSGFQAAAGSVMKFVEAANPGAVERFNLAMRDTIAVIGHALTPVLEIFTEAVRLVGDLLMTVLPDASAMRELLQPVFEVMKELREAFASIAPILRDQIAFGLKMFAIALQIALIPMRAFYQFLAGFLGVTEDLKSSVGAAARSINFTSQESFAKSVYQAAFKGTAGGGGNGELKVSAGMKVIIDKLSEIATHVGAIAKKIGAAAKAAGKAVRSPAGAFAISPVYGLYRLAKSRLEKNKGDDDGRKGFERRRVQEGVRRGIDGHPGGH